MELESRYRLDLLVESQVIAELKSVEALGPPYVAIILTYMGPSGHHLGLLMNFNVTVLKAGFRRYIL
jgi:GxxExxY protein